MKRTDEETREFLTRWLLEFGSGVIPNSEVYSCNRFYIDSKYSISDEPIRHCIDFVRDDQGGVAKQLNAAGLEFIKGDTNEL